MLQKGCNFTQKEFYLENHLRGFPHPQSFHFLYLFSEFADIIAGNLSKEKKLLLTIVLINRHLKISWGLQIMIFKQKVTKFEALYEP